MSLPLEIIELIVDALALKHRPSIKAFSLVCRALLPRCRKHLFETLVIHDGHPWRKYKTGKSLWEFFSGTREVCTHVRTIQYVFDNEPLLNGLIPLVSQRLTQLRSLHITRRYSGHASWNTTPHRHALLALIHLPTLTHLRLHSFDNFSIADLIPCAALKHLEISSVMLDDGPAYLQIPLPKPIMIDRLSIGNLDSESLRSLTGTRSDGKPILDLAGLKKICAKVQHKEGLRELAGLFEKAPHLVEVDVSTYVTSPPRLDGLYDILLKSLHTLRYLRVSFSILEISNSSLEDPILTLSRELDKLRFQNVIESIEVLVITDLGTELDSVSEWGMLGSMLSEAGWFSLQYVSLVIMLLCETRFDGDESWAEVLLGLRDRHFTKLLSSSIIQFDLKLWTGEGLVSYNANSSAVECEAEDKYNSHESLRL